EEQGVLQGGVDQVEVLDVIDLGLQVLQRDEGVEQRVLVVYLDLDIVKMVSKGLNAGGAEGELEILLVRSDVPPDERIGVEGHLREKDIHDLVVDPEVEIQVLVRGCFEGLVIGIDASNGILNQPSDLPYLEPAPHIARDDIRGDDFHGADRIRVKGGGHAEVLKKVGVVLVLVGGVGEIDLPFQIVQVTALDV